MDISRLIIDYRGINGITQLELSKAVKVSRKTIIKAEKGKSLLPAIERRIVLYIESNK